MSFCLTEADMFYCQFYPNSSAYI